VAGLVGKGPGSEPLLILIRCWITVSAEIDGVRFDGVDLFLSAPHIDDSTDDQIKVLADKISSKNLAVGSVVAPVWPPTGGGSAMGTAEERHRFVEQVKKAARISRKLRELGVRPYGVIRIDSATGVESWANDPEGSKKIASTFRECCLVAEEHGERLAAEGEICWGGMHSWKRMVEPELVGHHRLSVCKWTWLTLCSTQWDTTLPKTPSCRRTSIERPRQSGGGSETMTDALRPWTIDFHVAQNDATVKGSGSHDKTDAIVCPMIQTGLNIARAAGYWLWMITEN
jgi:hypothetical protein